jgi:hypothetical protein
MYTAHDAVWKMVDRDNKPVPDGQYRLFVELADYDTDEVKAKAMGVSNALVEVPFDTTKRPQTITLKDTDYLFNMNLSVK